MARVFISYKRVDKEKVISIAEKIQNDLGEPCWMDIDEIESDAQFASVIINAIDQAEVFLFMYSKAHTFIENYAMDWTIRELNYAQERNKRIVFINIDDTALTNWFIFMFPQKQRVNAQSESEIGKLIKDISLWLHISKRSSAKETRIETSLFRHTVSTNSDSPKTENREETRLNYSISGNAFAMIRVSHSLYIGETPVTQSLWFAIMHENPSRFKGDYHPVDSVSWNDCQVFIHRLNTLTGMCFRLPSENEWEFAAIGGDMSLNYLFSGSNILNEVAWNMENSDNQTHPVKQKKANELGLYDMSGNVWEWCSDSIEEKDYLSNANEVLNPRMFHVYKGGCWCETENCKPTARQTSTPNFKSYGGLGLRLALTV